MRQELVTFAIVVVVFTGCERQQPEKSAPRSEVRIDALPELDLTPGRIWFFKTIGRTEPAPAGTTPAIAFWKPMADISDSLTFSEHGAPTWKLPPGWSQKTIVEDRSFELVDQSGNRIEITSRSVADVSRDDAIKARLDIWRDELGLPPLPESGWTNAFETGVNKSTMSGRTEYVFQFGQATSPGTSATIIGVVVPYPDPASSK